MGGSGKGEDVLPPELLPFYNVGLVAPHHSPEVPVDARELRGQLFVQLQKRILCVEEHPIVTRFWLFAHCVRTLLMVTRHTIQSNFVSSLHACPDFSSQCARFNLCAPRPWLCCSAIVFAKLWASIPGHPALHLTQMVWSGLAWCGVGLVGGRGPPSFGGLGPRGGWEPPLVVCQLSAPCLMSRPQGLPSLVSLCPGHKV